MIADDIKFMEMAINIAEKGRGFTNPNPLVGCVITRDGEILGKGFHEKYGGLHAERNAIANSRSNIEGATMYVSLEPCCHYGKTPPCTEAIIANKIKRVVIGVKDPNPLVGGKGIKMLEEAGIEVLVGLCEEKIYEQNKIFFNYIQNKRPWVVLKTAMTLDGKIASYTGDSKWVSSELSRKYVHKLRAELMGILIGSGTANADNPMLNSRLEENVRQPIRILVSSNANISLSLNLLKTANQYPFIIAHTSDADDSKLDYLRGCGAKTILCNKEDTKVDISDLMYKLAGEGIDSILVEGGAEINYSLVSSGMADEIYAFIAPKIIGGRNAKTPIGGLGIEKMSDAIGLEKMKFETIGEDLLIKARFIK